MSLKTLEVEIDHGRVIPRKEDMLPAYGRALLTLLDESPLTTSTATEAGLASDLETGGIHPEIAAITGLVPADWNPREDHLRHLLDKHR